MKKINFNESKFSRFLKGKGFYVALCACVAVVGVAGYVTYKQTAERLENQLSSVSDNTSTAKEWGYDDFSDVNAVKEDEPKTTTAPETTTVPAAPAVENVVETKAQPLIMPLNGEIVNPFSNGNLVKSKTLNCWKTHDGVDIKGTLGDQVKSMTSGKVISVTEDPIWGVCVVIDHGNGLEGHYCNLNKTVPVKVDEKVSAGTIIGAIGDTAQGEVAEVSHLHFGLKQNGAWVDPISVIKPN